LLLHFAKISFFFILEEGAFYFLLKNEVYLNIHLKELFFVLDDSFNTLHTQIASNFFFFNKKE
jgi:hypothetical protein